MEALEPVDIARAWQEAANDQDVERLLALSDPAIEVVGPRGVAHGHGVLRAWLGRAGLRLTTLRSYSRGPVVVMAQRGVWHAAESGEVVGEALVASRFHVAEGKVAQYARYDSLEVALAEVGWGVGDGVRDVEE